MSHCGQFNNNNSNNKYNITEFYSNGDKYYGESDESKNRNGYGIYYCSNGDKYEDEYIIIVLMVTNMKMNIISISY